MNAYLSGKLETVDVSYLYYDIGPEAVAPMDRLAAEAEDPAVQQMAREFAEKNRERYHTENITQDLRGWNYVLHRAKKP